MPEDEAPVASQAKSLYSASTVLCADSVESHPRVPGLFALGTYQVDQEKKAQEDAAGAAKHTGSSGEENEDEEQQQVGSSTSPAYTRRGTVTLLQASHDPSSSTSDRRVQCKTCDQVDTAAVLDMRWLPSIRSGASADDFWLATAHATGVVELHALEDYKLKSLSKLTINPRNVLGLSLDWAQRSDADVGFIVSQSDGSLAYLPSLARHLDGIPAAPPHDQSPRQDTKFADDDDEDEDEDEEAAASHALLNDAQHWTDAGAAKPAGLETWHAHDNEAWIAAWDVWSGGSVLWSGESTPGAHTKIMTLSPTCLLTQLTF